MSKKKITFKQRIQRNDLKTRNRVAGELRKRMGLSQRQRNRFDNVGNSSRPLELLVEEVSSGLAIPSRDADLDPRSLTDLLLAGPAAGAVSAPVSVAQAASVAPGAGSDSASGVSAPRGDNEGKSSQFALLDEPLDPSHPLALPEVDTQALKELLYPEASQDDRGEPVNKNHYKRRGDPYLFWERVGVHTLLLQGLRAMRFTHPTPVQEEVLPTVLQAIGAQSARAREAGDGAAAADGKGLPKSGKKRKGKGSGVHDIVVSAETGSGKTLVFAIPIVHSILTMGDAGAEASATAAGPSSSVASEHDATDSSVTPPKKKRKLCKTESPSDVASVAPQSSRSTKAASAKRVMHTLIVTPTRELALQIKEALESLCKFAEGVVIGCIVGGMAPEKQQRILNRHPHVLISTPGRLWDLVQKNEGSYLGHSISRRLHYVVLDEADKLLQSGRFDELSGLLERIHSDILPAGFAQEREEGAVVEEHRGEVQEGHWDEETKTFVPFTKGKATGVAETVPKRTREDGSTAEVVADNEGGAGGREGQRKDQARPMPMPPPPPMGHRVATIITSATLSLNTNYERRDLKSRKSIIRTSNADTMNSVLQQLGIRPSTAAIFNVTPDTSVVAKINETYLRCPDNSKDLYLYYFLRTFRDRTIIFVNAISMLRRLVKILEVLEIPVVGLHASMQQRQRLKFIDRFKSGAKRVLVATDVASRGLDIEGLKYVVHYQVPRSTDSYIHRCGRTARCGGTGLSVLMVNAQEYLSFKKLMESLGRSSSSMEVFAMEPSVVHQLHSHVKMALQIDKLQKEVEKSRASNHWVSRMSRDAELDVDDMINSDADDEKREKLKAIKLLKQRLNVMLQKDTGKYGGKGGFRTSAIALGTREGEEYLRERAKRQTISGDAKHMRLLAKKKAAGKGSGVRKASKKSS